MAMIMKLPHIDELSGGRKRFRRRFPKALVQVLGEECLQVAMKAREGADLVNEHAALMVEFDKIVSLAKRKASGHGQLSPLEQWREKLKEADGLVASVIGPSSEDERREILADELERIGADPILYRAVVEPDAEAPPVTMQDAKEMYRKERLGANPSRNKRNQLERVCKRIEDTLGPLNKLALIDLKREHARNLRDAMLLERTSIGALLSPASVKREMNTIRAMVNLAIKEYDLKRKADNPFITLEMRTVDSAPENEWKKRDPLPAKIIIAMRERLRVKNRVPELGLIWRLLEGTGCRGSEIVGLRVEDVILNGPYPNIRVMWHEDRRVKTRVSIRSVPLVGDALFAAKDALELAKGKRMLFSRYAYDGGPDAVSQALMKHLRKFTKEKKQVVYSLRHNMKDLLVSAGVPERDENRILGHSLGGIGNRVYGGENAKLKAATEAMEKAIVLAPM